MSVFGKLMDKIFNRAEKVAPAAPAPTAAKATPPVAPAAAAPAATAVVDVEAILEDLAAKNPQKLNWRTSIVDLMKLLGMESSLAERRELAQELGYTGSLQDTATMNIWLHKQVLRKMAENGGKVPAELLD
jgi:3-oxoacyl-ACP reductase-like protein